MCGHGTIGLAVTLAHLGKDRPGPVQARHARRRRRLRVPRPTAGPPSPTSRATGTPAGRDRGRPRRRAGLGRRRLGGATGSSWSRWKDEELRGLARAESSDLPDHPDQAGPRSAKGSPGPMAARSTTSSCSARRATPREPLPELRPLPRQTPTTGVPCGTGTSAKLACLAADGKLKAGRDLAAREHPRDRLRGPLRARQRGARFTPSITGEAFITAEATLLFDPADPFRDGVRP